MKNRSNLQLVFFFAMLTVVVTTIVIFTWEKVFMHPFYDWIAIHYPGEEAARYNIEQRIEHFFISTTVDVIVVTLLLRIVSRQQRKLTASEERYRALFEHAIAGIGVVTATNHRLVEVNQKFGEILGCQAHEFIGRDIRDLGWVSPGGSTPNVLSEVLSGTSENTHELTIRTASGSDLPILIKSSALSPSNEKLIMLIIHDLSNRKRLEAEKEMMQRQLFQSSKLASIGELSAGVAHEINNPLNGIINYAQLLMDDNLARTENQQQMLNGIINESERISKIVRNLLTFARQDSHELAPIHITEIIKDSMSLLNHHLEKDGVTVEINVAEDLPPVLADGSRLRQVMINIISNAHHALKAKRSTTKLFRINARTVKRANGQAVCVEFHDTGVGMRRENIDKIFDPFFTTKRDSGGTGLGLSLSFGIVREYGGTITVESEEGRYTRFSVELPAADLRKTTQSKVVGVNGERESHSVIGR